MTRAHLTAFLIGVGLVSILATRPVAAAAKDGRGEVRAAAVCSAGATAQLRLRSGDRGIDLRFEVDHTRAGVVWRVALVHERRIVWRGAARTRRPGASFEVRRTLGDLPGRDSVSATAWGPQGLVCRATATLGDT